MNKNIPAKKLVDDWRIGLIAFLGLLLLIFWGAENGAYDGASSPSRADAGGIEGTFSSRK